VAQCGSPTQRLTIPGKKAGDNVEWWTLSLANLEKFVMRFFCNPNSDIYKLFWDATELSFANNNGVALNGSAIYDLCLNKKKWDGTTSRLRTMCVKLMWRVTGIAGTDGTLMNSTECNRRRCLAIADIRYENGAIVPWRSRIRDYDLAPDGSFQRRFDDGYDDQDDVVNNNNDDNGVTGYTDSQIGGQNTSTAQQISAHRNNSSSQQGLLTAVDVVPSSSGDAA
jgi:hypothetical protein